MRGIQRAEGMSERSGSICDPDLCFCWNYLPWQQLSVHPFWQQDWPHWPWQQALQFAPLADGTCAMAVTARTTAKESNAIVRFMKFSLDVKDAIEHMASKGAASSECTSGAV